ncbi:hypothetical protein B9Z19DRAFT_455276 [Tuber borchii]|uniref:Uncharacterized protein n=1 Tax=Tuber borchii TaxID=42251 RepID=A0A2T6ZFV7_TUBBO|nr:hypothetical protein B9Z19DRAFT_455276 [Tuber borchii]
MVTMWESGANWALPPELWHSEFLVWFLCEPSCQIVLLKKSEVMVVVSRHLLNGRFIWKIRWGRLFLSPSSYNYRTDKKMGCGEIFLRADSGAAEHVESRWQRKRHTTQYMLAICQYRHTRSTMAGRGHPVEGENGRAVMRGCPFLCRSPPFCVPDMSICLHHSPGSTVVLWSAATLFCLSCGPPQSK